MGIYYTDLILFSDKQSGMDTTEFMYKPNWGSIFIYYVTSNVWNPGNI